jgi:hypothetical protein
MGNRDKTQTPFGAWALAALQSAQLGRVQRGPRTLDETRTGPLIIGATFPDRWLEVELPGPVRFASEATVARVVELLWHSIGVRLTWTELCARSITDVMRAGGPTAALVFPSLTGPSVLEKLVHEWADDAFPEDEPLVVAAHLLRELLPEWLEGVRPIDPWYGRQALILMGIVHWPYRERRPDARDPAVVDRVLRMAAGDAPLRAMSGAHPRAPSAPIPPTASAGLAWEDRDIFVTTASGERLRVASFGTTGEAKMVARILGLDLDVGLIELAMGRQFLEEAEAEPARFRAAGILDADYESLRTQLVELETDRRPDLAQRLGLQVAELWSRLDRPWSGRR